MAQRNTFRDDEDLEEKINMRDLARVGVYLKPYMARVVWILIVVAAMGCINVVEPYLTKIMIDSVIPAKNLALLGELVALLAVLIVIYEFGLRYRTVEITRVGQLFRLASAWQNPHPRGQLCEHAFGHPELRSGQRDFRRVHVLHHASGHVRRGLASRAVQSRVVPAAHRVGAGIAAFPASRVPGAIQ